MIDLIGTGLAGGIAVNVGGNNTAAAMGPAYGAGVRTKVEAMAITALFVVLGAVTLGDRVIERLGVTLFETRPVAAQAFLLTVAPAITLAVMIAANLLRVPVATTQVAAATLIGLGIMSASLDWGQTGLIALWWAVTPIAAILAAYLAGRGPFRWIKARVNILRPGPRRAAGILITLSGAFVAFTIGANNAANSVAFLVAAGIMDVHVAKHFAAMAMALGVFLLGGPMLETVGRRITTLCEIRAVFIAVITGGIILTASLLGIPVSLNQTVTAAVIGFSFATDGRCSVYRNSTVRRIALIWAASPIASAILAIGLIPLVS